MRSLFLAFSCILCGVMLQAQTNGLSIFHNQVNYSGNVTLDEDVFIYLGKKGNFFHLVWGKPDDAQISWYRVQQSFDGTHFSTVDSTQPINLLDVFIDDYPSESDYYNRILYSTETGFDRFIYNDVMTAREWAEKNVWYRVKMSTTEGTIIYTKAVLETLDVEHSDADSRSLVDDADSTKRTGEPGAGNGSSSGGTNYRAGCPNIQTPPSGYVPTGNVRTFTGTCCFWEESEYILQNVTNPCGAQQAWCCAVDCVPLAYDPCCVHTCNEYNRCSCHPWICCNVSNAIIWVVTSSTDYVLNPTVSSITPTSCYDGADGAVSITTDAGVAPFSYEWENGTSTGFNITNMSAGNYSLTVSDNIGCSEAINITIPQPPTYTSTINPTHLKCYGDNDGAIDLTVTGGTPPYTYSWNGGIYTTQDLNNIGPGQYIVTVTDANGCTLLNDYIITEPTEFTGTVNTVDVECNGWNTGTAVLNVTGGTAPPTYIWSNGEITPNIGGLAAGVYFVTATDANGCSFTDVAIVDEPDPINAGFQITNTTCGSCNGSATVVVSGGSGNFNYQWSSTAGSQTTQTATNLCAGIHSVEVSEANVPSCSKTFSVSIGNSGAETITTSKVDVSCPGECTGSATVTIAGGCSDPPCTIEWFEAGFGASLNQTSTTANNLCAGEYLVQVTNNAGCQVFDNVTIAEPDPIAANLSIKQEMCLNACDGSITASPSGGTSPYTYQWLDGGGTLITGQTGPALTNLCPGDYSLVVTDANNCSATFNATIQAYQLAINISSTDNVCNGECLATATATVTGGTAPYTYQWLDGNGAPLAGQTNATAFNLCAGNYSLEVTDANNCSLTSNVVTVNEPSELSATASGTDVLCMGDCNGSVSVVAQGGTPPYAYQWFNGFGQPISGATATTLDNLCAGTYYVEVSDSGECSTGQLSVTIVEGVMLSSTITKTDISCNGEADGAIDLEVSGGDSPYTYNWNGGAFSTEDLSGLSAGLYSVTITDQNNCTTDNSITIIEPDTLSLSAVAQTYGNGNHLSCSGANDGSITAIATGGTLPYFYQWDDPAGQTSGIASGLGLGTYHVTVTDASGCSVSDSATLSLVANSMSATLVATTDYNGYNVSCNGANDGSVDLTITGGTPPLITNWDTASYFTEDLIDVAGGWHRVVIVDTINGCVIRDSIFLTQPSALSLTMDPSMYPNGFNVSSYNATDGSINLNVDGGVLPYSYLWNTGDTTEDISGLPEGRYSCEVTDGNGCVARDSIDLQGPPKPFVETIIDTSICDGQSLFAGGAEQMQSGTYRDTVVFVDYDSIIITNLSVLPNSMTSLDMTICEGESIFAGGAQQTVSGSYFDTLAAANGCDSILITNLTVLPNSNTTILIEICAGDSALIKGAYYSESQTFYDTLPATNSCDSIIATVLDVSDPILISFNQSNTDCAETACSGSIEAGASGGTPPYAYTWSNGVNISIIDSLCAGTYRVTVTDANGCSATDSVEVTDAPSFTLSTTHTDIECNCTNLISNYSRCVIDFADLPNGTLLGEQYAADGIHISGTAYGNLISQLIVFNSNLTGTQDPDLEVGEGNLAIFPENLTDSNGDGLVDAPNDHFAGGKQIYDFDTDRTVISFTFVDKENRPATATAYDASGNVITTATIQPLGNASVQTVMVNASGVRKLVIDYFYDSGGVGEIVLGCDYQCCDATASVLVSGGTPPFSYAWSNGENQATIDSLCAGTYSVTVTDAGGCSDSIAVDVEDFEEIIVTETHTDATDNCMDSAFFASPVCHLSFAGLPHGTLLNEQFANYGIHISGIAYGNFVDQLIVFNSDLSGTPDPDLEAGIGNLAIFPEDLTDNNNDGLVDVPNDQVAGGQQIYEFDHDMNLISFVFVDKDVDNHKANATVYDGGGNVIKTVAIPALTNGSVQTVMINASGVRKLVIDYFYDSGGITDLFFDCGHDCCDGTASVSVTGGQMPYTYQWSGGQTTASIDSLCEGTYDVTVTDADGCEESLTITIEGPEQTNLRNSLTGINAFEAGGLDVRVYPVPFENYFVIEINTDVSEDARIRVFDVIGKEMINKKVTLLQGENEFTITTEDWLSSGIYLLELRTSDKLEQLKLYK